MPSRSSFGTLGDAEESSDTVNRATVFRLLPRPLGLVFFAVAVASSVARLTKRISPFRRVMARGHSSRETPSSVASTTVTLAVSATETLRTGDGAGEAALSVSLLLLLLLLIFLILFFYGVSSALSANQNKCVFGPSHLNISTVAGVESSTGLNISKPSESNSILCADTHGTQISKQSRLRFLGPEDNLTHLMELECRR